MSKAPNPHKAAGNIKLREVVEHDGNRIVVYTQREARNLGGYNTHIAQYTVRVKVDGGRARAVRSGLSEFDVTGVFNLQVRQVRQYGLRAC